MEHIMQIAISVEDEKIVKRIEDKAEEHVLKVITEKVEDVVYEKNYYSRNYGMKDASPLREMVRDEIDKVLEENKDFILQKASEDLANRLARSKAGKAILEGLA